MNNNDLLIEQLIKKNVFNLRDGRELYEGTEKELMRLLEENKKGSSFGGVSTEEKKD